MAANRARVPSPLAPVPGFALHPTPEYRDYIDMNDCPLRIRARHVRITAMLGACLLAVSLWILPYDGAVTRYFYEEIFYGSSVVRTLARTAEKFAEEYGITITLLSILIFDRKQGWRKFVMVGMILLTCALVVTSSKMVVGRERPRVSEFETVVHGPRRGVGGGSRYHSYPSGHTTAAFTLAVATACAYRWTAGPMLFLAAMTGFSRIVTGYHFPTDVLAGAFLGTLIALVCVATGQPHGWTLRFQQWVWRRLGFTKPSVP